MGFFADALLPLLGLGATSWLLLIVYRLYFHPLASFPGPKSVIYLGVWHEVYHDVVRGGQLYREIEAMHDRYGPIVRINPNELHIRDADFFSTLYAPSGGGKLRNKYPWWCQTFGAPTSILATSDHELHRARRAPLNGFFSTKAVSNLEPLILKKVRELVSRLEYTADSKEVLRMDCAFTAAAMDIICSYAFGFDPEYVSQKDFNLAWKTAVNDMPKGGALVRAFPSILTISDMLPHWLLLRLNPSLIAFRDCNAVIRKNVAQILAEDPSEQKQDSSTSSVPTIFHALRDSDLPPSERSLSRLTNEAVIITSAATGTTSRTLEVMLVHLLSNPPLLNRLQIALDKHIPHPQQPLTSTSLRQIPFLNAVVLESLRLGMGMATRNPRVSPKPIQYRNFTIPPGTPVSESIPFVLLDPETFPNPKTFDPERWLGPDAGDLEAYKVFFGKGSRSCIGLNLAQAELFLVAGLLFRRVEMELVDTGVENVEFVRDYFGAAPQDPGRGVKVRVTGVRP